MNEATVGQIAWDGRVFEIDWPYQLADETKREDFGAIYLDGVLVGEFCPPLGTQWECIDDVIDSAFTTIVHGDIDMDGGMMGDEVETLYPSLTRCVK